MPQVPHIIVKSIVVQGEKVVCVVDPAGRSFELYCPVNKEKEYNVNDTIYYERPPLNHFPDFLMWKKLPPVPAHQADALFGIKTPEPKRSKPKTDVTGVKNPNPLPKKIAALKAQTHTSITDIARSIDHQNSVKNIVEMALAAVPGADSRTIVTGSRWLNKEDSAARELAMCQVYRAYRDELSRPATLRAMAEAFGSSPATILRVLAKNDMQVVSDRREQAKYTPGAHKNAIEIARAFVEGDGNRGV